MPLPPVPPRSPPPLPLRCLPPTRQRAPARAPEMTCFHGIGLVGDTTGIAIDLVALCRSRPAIEVEMKNDFAGRRLSIQLSRRKTPVAGCITSQRRKFFVSGR